MNEEFKVHTFQHCLARFALEETKMFCSIKNVFFFFFSHDNKRLIYPHVNPGRFQAHPF